MMWWGTPGVVFSTVLVNLSCRVLFGTRYCGEGRGVYRIGKQAPCAMREPWGQACSGQGRLMGVPFRGAVVCHSFT